MITLYGGGIAIAVPFEVVAHALRIPYGGGAVDLTEQTFKDIMASTS